MSSDIPENDDTQTRILLTKGTMVDHYRIVEKIGAGGMGDVYLAEDTKLGRKVALKFLADQFSSDQSARDRFTREAQAVAAIDHPNIVSVYEVNEFKGRPYFVMQYIEGKSVEEVIKGKQPQMSEIIRLAIQICEGLQAAHNQGIVHRDIKPSNILIDKDGRARILDFGLATISGMDKLTQTGTTLGTLSYMSPEQVQAEETDLRSDIFSFGVVLYEMITGQRPFGGDSAGSILHAITHDEVEPLARFKSGVTDKLQQIVNRALQKKRSLRYQTAADMLADLKQATAAEYPKQKSMAVVTFSAGIILLIAFGTYFIFSIFLAETTKRIVVLPFENLGAVEHEYFSDGITDEITSRLAIVSELAVISRTSARKYKNTDKSLPEISRALDVD
ncbi:MAG: serine/threonine-protein kinase, partial [candidate division Zixibacteria bacterium]